MARTLTTSRTRGASRRARPGATIAAPAWEQLGEIQRARIVAATLEVVGAMGAANVAVAHIVERAGVSRRTFYELFEGREDCCLAAFEQALDRAGSRVSPAYAEQRKWREQVRAGLVALLGFFDEEPTMARMLVVESLSAGRRTLERREQALGALASVVDEGRAQSANGAALPPLTAYGLVGGAVSLVHMQLARNSGEPLLALTNQLMSMIVLPYQGAAAARAELERPVEPSVSRTGEPKQSQLVDPFKVAGMRLTYRTVRVLLAIGENPGASNRTVGTAAEVNDQGQISKLLRRLQHLGLVSNTDPDTSKGTANAWMLTAEGSELIKSIGPRSEIES
jgi:AcrR family transcriptional regulator/DNA-binding MarR family transcriptional regulator